MGHNPGRPFFSGQSLAYKPHPQNSAAVRAYEPPSANSYDHRKNFGIHNTGQSERTINEAPCMSSGLFHRPASVRSRPASIHRVELTVPCFTLTPQEVEC